MNWAMTLTFCKIELIGTWLWVTGKTQPIKDMLKEKGFHWASRKECLVLPCGAMEKEQEAAFSLTTFGQDTAIEVLKEEEDQRAISY